MVKTRKISGVESRGFRSKPVDDGSDDILLPTKYKEVSNDFGSFSMLLYGEKKIGKTSLCSQFPDATFLMFEPGDKALSIRSVHVPSWKAAKNLLDQLEDDSRSDDPVHKTVIMDVADKAYDQCFKYMCQKMGIMHPQDENDYGKSWGEIKKEWERFLVRLLSLGKGVIFISHAKFNQITKRDNSKIDVLGPTVGGQALGVLEGLVDTIAYYGYNEDTRTLVIRGNEYIDAGTRIDEMFLTRKTKEQVRAIDMGSSKEEAYNNLLRAFSNLQPDIGELPLVRPPVRKTRKQR